MNKRETESLAEKTNESLMVLPVLFSENGYDVVVSDPPYANYDWVPDVSIYDGYDNIKAGVLEYSLNEEGLETGEISMEMQKRNMFCYSFMVCSPQIVRNSLYNKGFYRKEKEYYAKREELITQSTVGKNKAHGLQRTFMDWYAELEMLPELTEVSEKDKGSFLMITNGLTHEIAMLQEPDMRAVYGRRSIPSDG